MTLSAYKTIHNPEKQEIVSFCSSGGYSFNRYKLYISYTSEISDCRLKGVLECLYDESPFNIKNQDWKNEVFPCGTSFTRRETFEVCHIDIKEIKIGIIANVYNSKESDYESIDSYFAMLKTCIRCYIRKVTYSDWDCAKKFEYHMVLPENPLLFIKVSTQ